MMIRNPRTAREQKYIFNCIEFEAIMRNAGPGTLRRLRIIGKKKN